MNEIEKNRIRLGLNFKESDLYLYYRQYFNASGMVHSVVVTRQGCCILRLFRGETNFGPLPKHALRQKNLFRVDENNFHYFIVEPNQLIAKAAHFNKKCRLLEIVIYDDHVETASGLRSGEYVAVQNVHYATKFGVPDTLTLHGGGETYNRGISRIPDGYRHNDEFGMFDAIKDALDVVPDEGDFMEFEQQVVENPLNPVEPAEPEPVQVPPVEIAPSIPGTSAEDLEFAKPCQKIVLADIIAVDYFRKTSKCQYHFLTHAHSDHYRGIDSKYEHKIYCSEKTAKVLPIILDLEPDQIAEDWIIPIKENTPLELDGFTVTPIEANHVFGAVMFVFEGPLIEQMTGDGVGKILCTGDFRAEKDRIEQMKMEPKYQWFFTSKFSKIYLDNTYFSVDEKFVTWIDAADLVQEHLTKHPLNDFYIPLHRLGREVLLDRVAYEIQEPVKLYDEKERVARKIMRTLDMEKKKERTIHVVKRNEWRGPAPQDAFIMEITQLHHLTGQKHAENVIHIPYSDHSSRQEILDFLSLFEFSEIYPSSKKYSKSDFQAMMRAGKGFTEENLERQLKLHTFVGLAESRAVEEAASDSAPQPVVPGSAPESPPESDTPTSQKSAPNAAPESAPEFASQPVPVCAPESSQRSAANAAPESAPEFASQAVPESADTVPNSSPKPASDPAPESAPEFASQQAPVFAPDSAIISSPPSSPKSAPGSQSFTFSAPLQAPIVRQTKSETSASSLQENKQPKSSGKRPRDGPLPPGVEWQDDEYDYMSREVDTWPEGPPKSEEEALHRMVNNKRRRI